MSNYNSEMGIFEDFEGMDSNPSIRDEFIAWCRSQPADATYQYMDNANCALAQFGKSREALVDGEYISASDTCYFVRNNIVAGAERRERVVEFQSDDSHLISAHRNFHALADALERNNA